MTSLLNIFTSHLCRDTEQRTENRDRENKGSEKERQREIGKVKGREKERDKGEKRGRDKRKERGSGGERESEEEKGKTRKQRVDRSMEEIHTLS